MTESEAVSTILPIAKVLQNLGVAKELLQWPAKKQCKVGFCNSS
jgi:hypothetical protein